jgi:hypothetical protein
MQVVDSGHGLFVEGQDHVAVLQASARRRTLLFGRRDQHTGRDRDLVGARQGARNRAPLGSEPAWRPSSKTRLKLQSRVHGLDTRSRSL